MLFRRRKRATTEGPITETNPHDYFNRNIPKPPKEKEKLVPRMHRELARNALRAMRIANDKTAEHSIDMIKLFPEHGAEIAAINNRDVTANEIEGNTHSLYYSNPKIKNIQALYDATLKENPDYERGIEISGDALARAKRGEPPHFTTDVNPGDR